MKKLTLRLLCTTAVAAVLGFALSASATPPRPWGCECAYIDLPVICDGGVVYLNQCVADCVDATGCVPYNP